MTGKRLSKSAKERHCENWHSSGLTQKEYCKHTGLNVKTFGSWAREYKVKQLKLLPIELKDAPKVQESVVVEKPPSFKIEITLPNGASIHLPDGINLQLVTQVLKEVCSCN
jgi:hypothetical protein